MILKSCQRHNSFEQERIAEINPNGDKLNLVFQDVEVYAKMTYRSSSQSPQLELKASHKNPVRSGIFCLAKETDQMFTCRVL